MDHAAHYDRLIARAVGRVLTGYSERHHIVPKCLGGSNAESNIVRLTAEEHYVAHQLLIFMHPGNRKILWAASQMSWKAPGQVKRPTNKRYGWIRRKLAADFKEHNPGRSPTAETRARMSASHRGIKRGPHSEERKAKIAAAHKGKVKSPEHLAALSASKTGKKRGPHSELHRQRQSASIKLALQSVDRSAMGLPAYRQARRTQMIELWAQRKRGDAPMPDHGLRD